MRQDVAGDDTTIELATPLQFFSAIDEGQFVDGPENDVVKVLDFDQETGQPLKPMKFVLKGIGKSVSCYEIGYSDLGPDSAPEEFETHEFMQISTFATVLKILDFFESTDILGRKISWAFTAKKLIIIPQAGEAKNAFYDRRNHNLQFYYHQASQGHTIYTALSHDIVVHECTHAILDGIAPDLYNSILPESLALHEAIADISAIMQTLLNEMVLFSYDALTGGTDKDEYSALTNIAEEFGTDIRLSEGRNYLRRMKNDFRLRKKPNEEIDKSLIVKQDDPHQLSNVLSGILYTIIELRMQNTDRSTDFFATLDKVFIPAARRVARIIFRALDYLPPGETSFIDYGRAFIVAAKTTYKKPQKEVRWLKAEFVRRGIVEHEDDLESDFDPVEFKLTKAQAKRLANSDEQIAEFVKQHKDIFRIPNSAKYSILPKVLAHKAIGKSKQNNLFIKVRWEEIEHHDIGAKFKKQWAIKKGTTLAIDLDHATANRLTTISTPFLTKQRGKMLVKLSKKKQMQLKKDAAVGNEKQATVLVDDRKGVMHVEGSMRLLHIVATN